MIPSKKSTLRISWKQWVHEEAQRIGIQPGSLYYRIKLGRYPGLQREVENRRVIWVVAGKDGQVA